MEKKKKDILVGYTGFVGGNILKKHNFDGLYNSHNYQEAYGTNPDLCVYAGIPAEKFYANLHPDEDLKIIYNAFDSIKQINPKKLVLISTVDVYEKTENVSESFEGNIENICAYGKNRLILENMVRKEFPNCLIVRLPALFGNNLKKNFIFDILHPIPQKLNEKKIVELGKDYLLNFYTDLKNGFFGIKPNFSNSKELLHFLETKNFIALNFTDSRNTYQFYNLENLWKDIQIAIQNDIQLLTITSEPLTASEIYSYIFNKTFKNEFLEKPVKYNLLSDYASYYKGKNGYLYGKNEILSDLKKFIDNYNG